MKKVIVIIWLQLLAATPFLFAQDVDVLYEQDSLSLERLVASSPSKSSVDALNQLMLQYKDSNRKLKDKGLPSLRDTLQYQRSLVFSLEVGNFALQMAQRIKYWEGIELASRELGGIVIDVRERRKAAEFYRILIAAAEELKDAATTRRAFHLTGRNFYYLGEHDSCILYMLNALEIAKQQDSMDISARINSFIGLSHFYLKNYDEAISRLNTSLIDAKKAGSDKLVGKAYSNLGLVYQGVGLMDSVSANYDKAEVIAHNTQDSVNLASIYINRGLAYESDSNYTDALLYYQKSIEICKQSNNRFHIGWAFNNAGHVFEQMKKYESAKAYYYNALAVARERKEDNLRALVYDNISDTYVKQDSIEQAYDYLKRHDDLQDVLAKNEQAETATRLDAVYNMNQQEKRVALAQKEQVQRTRERNLIFIGSFILLLVLAVGFYFYLKHAKTQHFLESIQARLDGQETERKRIAQNLHDGLGGTLAAIKMTLDGLDKDMTDLPSGLRRRYDFANRMLGEACNQNRQIAHELGDTMLVRRGLFAALQELVDNYNETGKMKVEYEQFRTKHERLEPEVESHLYHIVLELFQNIVKHAQAKKVQLKVSRHSQGLTLIVNDDGIGFDQEEVSQRQDRVSMGSSNLRARVNGLKGRLKYDSKPGKGTNVIVEIPLDS